MSMSQEEIESLMNGIDLAEDEASAAAEEENTNTSMSENDIADLIAQTDLSEEISNPKEVAKEEDTNVDDILKELDIVSNNDSEASDEDELDVDNLIKELDATQENDENSENIDDILASIENMDTSTVVDDIPLEKEKEKELANAVSHEESGKEWAENKIQEGVFPFPADQDTKVVSQLSEVANDTEEKSLQIFDVLSLVLDNNDASSKDIKCNIDFVEKQIVLLKKLNNKFPNISEFKENLDMAILSKSANTNLLKEIDTENMKIFGAMELMQFNDINRQKIERVMSVIRKLSSYLNNLFEDDTPENEIIVAKHIHGDNSEDLLADEDLESLISEFGK